MDDHYIAATFDWARIGDNHGQLAALMLDIVDRSPISTGAIDVPKSAVSEINAVEDVVIREYDRAKRDRPNLAVKLTKPTDDYPDAALLVIVHEHHWVGGRCVNGCTNERPV